MITISQIDQDINEALSGEMSDTDKLKRVNRLKSLKCYVQTYPNVDLLSAQKNHLKGIIEIVDNFTISVRNSDMDEEAKREEIVMIRDAYNYKLAKYQLENLTYILQD